MNKKILKRIEEIFTEKLQAKTGWSKNEVLAAYKDAVNEALTECVDECRSTEQVNKPNPVTDNPELDNPDDIYYTGSGATFGTDKNGAKYWKLYHPGYLLNCSDRFKHLNIGDIVNEKERIRRIVFDAIIEAKQTLI